MPNQLDDSALTEAQAAVRHARMVREQHRRRTERGSPQRESDISRALERLREAMKPLRSEIGRFVYPASTAGADKRQEIRAASDAIQRERRKLWKMQSKRKTAAV